LEDVVEYLWRECREMEHFVAWFCEVVHWILLVGVHI
jgi:hypothetical protein